MTTHERHRPAMGRLASHAGALVKGAAEIAALALFSGSVIALAFGFAG